MDLFFNELSLKNETGIHQDSINAMVMVYKELLKYHITTCRIAPKDNTKLFQMICALPDSVNVKNFYFSFFRSPYESETVEEKQDDYYTYNWTCHGKECIGIALTFLLDSICFSIYSQNWNSPFIDFFQNETSVCVRNISIKEHVDIHLSQMQTQTGAELPECDIPVSDKKIVLRKDHGMDVLEAFCKRLIHSPYLIGVVNSLPYNPHERKFIRKVRENGLIEIVLPWTDEGYGIVVKTTGRTIRETKRISEIITEEFGYL